MKKHLLTIVPLVLGSLLLTTSLVCAQGNLTPSGPPGPTMKKLDEVEPRTLISSLPFTITNSGSYYLAASLTGASGANGITIATNNVTIDLNGFALLGVTGSSNAIVSAKNAAYSDISIYNGTVRSWGAGGINLSNCSNLSFKQIKADSNNGPGLAGGNGTLVADCIAAYNNPGIVGGAFSQVRNCSCYFNGSPGIYVNIYSTVSGCVTYADGATEINAVADAIVEDCVTYSQGQNCILVSDNCKILRNSCNGNGPGGGCACIHATGTANRIEANRVAGAGYGIKLDADRNQTLGNAAFSNGSNYSIASGNYTATIVTTEAAMNTATNSNFNLSVP